MILFFISLAHSLQLWQAQEGQLKEYDFKIYELNITDQEQLVNKTLVVVLMPTIGKPDLALNCDTQVQLTDYHKPKLMEFFDWQGESDYFQEIAISYKERQLYNCSDKQFYIGISSEAAASFHIYAYIIQYRLPMIFNMPISGVLELNDFNLFSLHPQKDYEQISVQVLHGNLTMYVRQCENDSCNLTKDDLNATDLVKDKQYVNFVHNKDECQNCYYLIGIKSNDPQKYRIVAKHNSTRGILREGWFDTQVILDGEYKYYEFDIPDNQYLFNKNSRSIEKIIFLTTLDYGSIKIQTSQQNMFPNLTDFEYQDDSYIELNKFQNKIYISIYGVEQSYYIIYVAVKRSLKLSQTNFIQLQSGKQQNFTQNEEFSFFKFQVDNEKKQNITITLTPIKGEFLFYVIGSKNESDEIPDSYSAQWEGVRSIIINYDVENQYENYYITVEKLSNDSGIFKIQYIVTDTLQFANIGDQIIDTVYPNQYNYYKIPMVAENLTITKNIYSHSDIESLQIYISLNQENLRPNANNYTYYFNSKSIELSGQDLFCDKNLIYHIAQHICYIYISVTSNETVFYSLQSFLENTVIQLFEGYPIHLPLGNYSFFYNLVGKEIQVYARSHGGDLNLTAWYGTTEQNKTQVFSGRNDWFSSQELTIPQSNEPRLNIEVVTNGTKSEYSYLLVGIYQEVQFLSESIPIKGQLDEGQINYYSIKVTQNNTILISLNTFSGSGYIVADKGLDTRPTFHKSTYISYGYYHDHIYIDNQITDTIGDYIIGVQCFQDCIYQIVYTSGKFQMFHLLQDHQFDHYFHPYQPVYFVIDQLRNQTLKLLINMIDGQVLVNMKEFNNTHFEQVINDTKVIQKTLINRDTKFILNQTNQSILVEIIAQNQIAHSVVELVSLKNPMLLKDSLSWRDQLDADQSSLYYAFTKDSLQLQMNVYLGEIRMLIKQGVQQFHDDEADFSYRISSNQLVKVDDKIKSDMHIIKIIGIQANNVYTIQAIRNINKIPLNYGYPIVGHAYKDNITYTFESNQNQNELITMMIHFLNCNETCISVEVNHTNETFSIYNIEKSENLLIYQLYTVQGVYSINIIPNHSVSYQIVVNANQTYYFLENMLWQIQQSQSKQNTFELFVEEKTQFQLRAFTCGGTFLVQATKDIKNADKSLFEIQFQLTPQQLVQKVLLLDPGIYYFVFRGVRMPYVSSYQRIMIKGQFLNLTERSPQENYKIRQNGIITHTLIDKQISIRVPTIERMNNQDNVTKIQIIINLNNNPDNVLLCENEALNETLIQSDHTIIYDQDNYQYPVYAFMKNYNHSFKYIHAIANVYIDDVNQATYLYQSSQIIDVSGTDNDWLRILIIVFIILLIILVTYFILRLQYAKYKKNENKPDAQIEMNYQVFR